jgi:hypothetical protein
MSFHRAIPEDDTRLVLPVSGLLDTALGRLQRQTQYAGVLARGGKRAEALRSWLTLSADCIAALARPEASFMPVTARPVRGGVCLADRVTLEGVDIPRGGRVTAYLLTLNYTQSQALEWLDRDYGAHHIQSDLGREVLFALGREAYRVMAQGAPTGRMRRIPVLAGAQCGNRRIWDPARVQDLLSVFHGINPGVQVTDTGCFQPLNSILGLALHSPAR